MSFQEHQKTKINSNQEQTWKPPKGVYPPSWILTVEWYAAKWCCCGDIIVFAVHTEKTPFSNNSIFRSFHSRERFRIDPFSLIVFGVVVWMVAVSGRKRVSFSFENGSVWTGSK